MMTNQIIQHEVFAGGREKYRSEFCILQSASSETVRKRGADKAHRLALADLPKRPCTQCGETYQPLKKDQSFCSKPCKTTFHNLRQQLGGQILDVVIAWRLKRLPGGFTPMCREVDRIIREYRGQLGHAVSNGKAGFGRMSRRKS